MTDQGDLRSLSALYVAFNLFRWLLVHLHMCFYLLPHCYSALGQVKQTTFMSRLDFILPSDPGRTTAKQARKKSKARLYIIVSFGVVSIILRSNMTPGQSFSSHVLDQCNEMN